MKKILLILLLFFSIYSYGSENIQCDSVKKIYIKNQYMNTKRGLIYLKNLSIDGTSIQSRGLDDDIYSSKRLIDDPEYLFQDLSEYDKWYVISKSDENKNQTKMYRSILVNRMTGSLNIEKIYIDKNGLEVKESIYGSCKDLNKKIDSRLF